MRFCHVAGIRPVLSRPSPVLSRPSLFCSPQLSSHFVARSIRLSLSLRHKSSNANHVDNTVGTSTSHDDKKVADAVKAIMDSMKGSDTLSSWHSQSQSQSQPHPDPLAIHSLGPLRAQDAAKPSPKKPHRNPASPTEPTQQDSDEPVNGVIRRVVESGNHPREPLPKQRPEASQKQAGYKSRKQAKRKADKARRNAAKTQRDSVTEKTPVQIEGLENDPNNHAAPSPPAGHDGKQHVTSTTTATATPTAIATATATATEHDGTKHEDHHTLLKSPKEPAAKVTQTGHAARSQKTQTRKLGRIRFRLSHPRKPLPEHSSEQPSSEQPSPDQKQTPPVRLVPDQKQTPPVRILPDQKQTPPDVKDESPLFEPIRTMTLEEAMRGNQLENNTPDDASPRTHKRMSANIEYLKASELDLTPLQVDQPPVPRLSHGLDRVLFNQGVYQLQDPYSMVYNFDPYLQKIMPVTEFDFNALAEYKTSSQDTLLADMAQQHNIKYVGSTSSMTSTLGHFHYLLSNWRDVNLGMLSKDFPETSTTFTEINRAPNAMFLRRKNGIYAIDADKEYDGANVLMLLGKSLEKLLTMTPHDFERYRKSDPRQISDTERNAPDSFHFSTQGDFLMRSQLDAHDPRLPGTGMFDLKTRAVVSIRMQSNDYEEMSGYELHKQHGRFESFEREYYDMARSTMLKYSLQARMGRMDGIFVAYHNVKRIFGFQYLNLSEMDRSLHGQTDRCLGNQEFGLSIELLNKILNKATERYPDRSIRFHFETRPSGLPFMYIFAEPMAEEDIDKIQNSQKAKVAEFEREVMGLAPKEDKQSDEAADDMTAEDTTELETGTLNVTGNLTITGVQPSSTPEPSTPTAKEDEATDSKTAETAPAGPSTDTNIPIDPSLNTSDSPADSSFLSLLTLNSTSSTPKDESHRDLLAFTLTVRSRVNGAYVERPENLSPDDKWSVEYSLSEISSPDRAWALYEATRARRRKVFERANKTEDEGPDGGAGRRGRGGDEYIRMLRQLSQKGRDLRAEIDAVEADRGEKVVFGEPFGKADEQDKEKSGGDDDVVDVKSVDDYTKWLFGHGAGR